MSELNLKYSFLYYFNRLLANGIIILRNYGDIKEYLERCMEVEKTSMGIQARLEAKTISISSVPQTPGAIHIKIIIQIAYRLPCYVLDLHGKLRR